MARLSDLEIGDVSKVLIAGHPGGNIMAGFLDLPADIPQGGVTGPMSNKHYCVNWDLAQVHCHIVAQEQIECLPISDGSKPIFSLPIVSAAALGHFPHFRLSLGAGVRWHRRRWHLYHSLILGRTIFR